MDKDKDPFWEYFFNKYPNEDYTAKEIINFKQELRKKYGDKIIPELEVQKLSAEEQRARLEYAAWSSILRETWPEVGRFDKAVDSFAKAESKAVGRFANAIFFVFKLAAVAWMIIVFLFTAFGADLGLFTAMIALVVGAFPYFVIAFLEVLYLYIAGIIDFESIGPLYKEYLLDFFR